MGNDLGKSSHPGLLKTALLGDYSAVGSFSDVC
jgi:hypothetical protein